MHRVTPHRSHTPNHLGVWDRGVVTSVLENGRAAGPGKSRSDSSKQSLPFLEQRPVPSHRGGVIAKRRALQSEQRKGGRRAE